MNRTITHIIRVLSLIAITTQCSLLLADDPSESESSPIKVIQPNKKVTGAKAAAIDTESFELGLYLGNMSVEDFSNNLSMGLSFTYHINEHFIAQLNYGQTDVGRATFEDVFGGDFLQGDDEVFKYTDLLAGYKLFRGRSYLGEKSKFNSDIYVLAGFGSVDFAGDSGTSLVLGTSYRVVLTDWLTWNLDLRDHIFDREFLSDSKQTHNIELTVGFNVLF